MNPQQGNALRRSAGRIGLLVTLLVATVSLFVTAALPLGYLAIGYRAEANHAATLARVNANRVARYAYRNPTLWQYETLRLRELLLTGSLPELPLRQRIVSSSGHIVVREDKPLAAPLLVRSADIVSNGRLLGRLEVEESLRPLLRETGLLALTGLLLGVALFFAARIVPARILRTSFQELEAAQAGLRRAHDALDQAADGIVILDADGIICYVNPAFARLAGHTTEALIGRPEREFFPDIVRDRPRCGEAGEPGMPPGSKLHHRLPDALGTMVELDITYSPIRDEHGELTHCLGMWQDVTERLQLEGRLRHSLQMRALGTLAGGIAHDLNNILVPIAGYAELLMRNVSPDSREHAQAEAIHHASLRAGDLVSRIMTFGRRRAAQRLAVPLEPLVREVAHWVRSSAPPGVEVTESLPPDMPPVFGDQALLYQMLINLAGNAEQALGERGTLHFALDTITLERHQDAFGTVRNGPFVRLSIRDDGPGMDAETLASAFDPFFTTREVGQGSGLGLSVVYGIVQQHEGDIAVRSAPNAGTTVEILLPVAPESGPS